MSQYTVQGLNVIHGFVDVSLPDGTNRTIEILHRGRLDIPVYMGGYHGNVGVNFRTLDIAEDVSAAIALHKLAEQSERNVRLSAELQKSQQVRDVDRKAYNVARKEWNDERAELQERIEALTAERDELAVKVDDRKELRDMIAAMYPVQQDFAGMKYRLDAYHSDFQRSTNVVEKLAAALQAEKARRRFWKRKRK